MDALFSDRDAPALNRIGWIWVVYAVLFGLSIPWYLPADAPPRIWLGLPHWVVLSLAAVAGAAVFTAYVLRRYWPDSSADAEGVAEK